MLTECGELGFSPRLGFRLGTRLPTALRRVRASFGAVQLQSGEIMELLELRLSLFSVQRADAIHLGRRRAIELGVSRGVFGV
jgi:hypothetical protein